MGDDARPAPGGDLLSAFRRTGLTTRELWFRYLSLGGNADEVGVDAQVHGLMALPAGEFNVLAHAVNEALEDLPPAERGAKVRYVPTSSPTLRRST